MLVIVQVATQRNHRLRHQALSVHLHKLSPAFASDAIAVFVSFKVLADIGLALFQEYLHCQERNILLSDQLFA